MKIGKLLLAAILFLAAAVTVQGRSRLARPRRYYVAPTGSDAWSGRLSAPNQRRTDGPFATLVKILEDEPAAPKGNRIDRGERNRR
jgi:hypothetical protein